MEFTPEVAPLLDRNRYAVRLAFLFPMVLERAQKAGKKVDVDLVVNVFTQGETLPVVMVVPFPEAKANVHQVIELNPLLRQAGVAPEAPGFVTLHARVASPDLPPVLKIVGFWVSYRNADVYAVLPSNVKYNSSRVDFGSAADAHLLDYFGAIRLTPESGAHLSILNPFPVRSEVRVEALEGGRLVGTEAFVLEPLSVRWMDVEKMLPIGLQTTFDGTVRLVSTHRVVWFVWFRDRVRDLFYSADHAIPWINRQL